MVEPDTRFTPRMFIDYYVSLRGIGVADLGVSPTTIVTWWLGVARELAEAVGAQPSPHWMYGERNPLYAGQLDGRRVSIAHLPVGAPGTVMFMEELIACGAERFLALGLGGGLQPEAPRIWNAGIDRRQKARTASDPAGR